MYWALTHLTSLPDPTKSIEEQDTRLLDILMEVEDVLVKEAERKEE